MSYLMLALGDGDAKGVGAVRDACASHMENAGASVVRGAAILTGPNSGKGVMESEWDSPDAYFDNRSVWLTTPEAETAFSQAGISSVQVAMAEINGVRGTCEGKYGVALLQSATDSSQATTDRLLDAVNDVMIGEGANGLRSARLLTGDNAGMAMGVFFVDSLAAYFGNLQRLLTDENVVNAFAASGLVTHRRSIIQFV